MFKRSDEADPLSDILSLLKPQSIACGAVDAGDLHITFPAHQGVKCHAVMAGEAWLSVKGGHNGIDGSGGIGGIGGIGGREGNHRYAANAAYAEIAPLHLVAGDFVILPHGRAYALASDLGLAPVDYRSVLSGRPAGGVLSYNGGGKATIISVVFTIDDRHAAMLLNVLPSVVHLRANVDQPSLKRSLHQMMEELRGHKPGSRLIVEQLTTMMLTQALRTYLADVGEQAEEGRVGWLFALADPRIASAIGAMHADPAYRWTVQDLAERAGMGRTSFANQFKDRVGLPPMEYLTRLRMMLASDRLSNSSDAVNVVAEAMGYESESAFSKAFKRHLGASPRRYAKNSFSNITD